MIQARAGEVLVRLHDGRALAISGGDSSLSTFPFRASTEAYDPRTDTWSRTAPLLKRLCGPAGIVLRGGRVLVAGGYVKAGKAGYRPTRTAELYNPATNRWTMTGSMSRARAYEAIAMLPNGRVMVAGGRPRRYGGLIASSEIYNPRTGRWHDTDSLSHARATPWTARLDNGDILIAGGGDRTAEVYHVAEHQWRPAGTLRTDRDPALFSLPNGHVLAIAGGPSQVDEYLPAKNVWRVFPPLPQTHFRQLMQVVSVRGQPLVLGGFNRSQPQATGYQWSPARHRWLLRASMPRPKANFGAVRLADRSILVAGGWVRLSEGTDIASRYAARYYPNH
jgi:hypothetical protein